MTACKGLQKGRGDGAGRDRQGGHRFRTARTRRRRLPDRHQVEDRARHDGGAEIHRLQRRRGRQRHLRRPHDHGGRPLRADRRHGDRRQSPSARPRATSISARNIRMRRRPSTRPFAWRGAPACWAPACSVRHIVSTWRCGSAPAPMSAAKRRRCWNRWRAGAAWSAPSRLCRPTRACSASRRSSTM